MLKNHYEFAERKRGALPWRSLFLMLALLLGCHNLLAQVIIPANNSFTTTSYRPVGAFYGYDRTLSIYTASEMNIAPGATITGVRYFVEASYTPVDVPVFIYMKGIGYSSSYTSGVYNTGLIGATLVYAGTLQAADVKAGRWVTFPFTTPFPYVGQNIQILVGSNIGGGTGQGSVDKTFRWHAATAQTQTWQSNIQATFPSNGTVTNSKPNIQILYNTPGETGTLNWDYPTLSMLENRTQTITVNRSGGAVGALSIDYATSDGTAIAGLDYTATSGTLTWADGDMEPKSFTITTLADFINDDAETVNITLTNAQGAPISGPANMVLSITDVLPPMNGTYTVGAGGNFSSLTNNGGLFQAINNRVDGVSGPLTINIISDLTGETGTIGLNEIAGGHAVRIQPFGGPRTISGALGTTSNMGLIRFDGTDNVTIDGSLSAANMPSCQIGGDAALRQLTIINNSIGNTAAVLFQSSTTGANNNTAKNLNVTGYSPNVGYGIMFRVFPHSIAIPSLVNNQNSRIENCAVKRASVGIYSAGSTTSNPNLNTTITGNDISATGVDRVSRSAILIANETNPQVTFNKVNIQNTSTDMSETVGLAIGASQAYATSVTSGGISGAMVANNWITGVVSNVDLGGSTAGIAISGTAFGTPNTVQNNMISNVSGLSQYTYNVAGIWVVGAVASETKLYHNTISLYGDRGARTNQSPSYGIAISGLDPSVEMKNNIISTTQIATGGGAVKTYAFGTLSTTFANLISDHNVFYSGGVQDGGFRSGSLSNNAGTSYATLAEWTAATGDDTHSIEVAPVFAAANDLHLAAASNPIITATPGSPLPSVATDMDCNLRNNLAPAMGAHEIQTSGFSISAAAGTGGTISPSGVSLLPIGANQVYTIAPACGYVIADVKVDGISQGSVTGYTFSNVNANHTITATYTAQVPTITAAGPTTFCVGGSVVLTSSAASGNVWSTGETTQSITALAAGNYFVTANNGSCASPASNAIAISITTPPTAPTINVGGSLTFCQGGSVTLTSSSTTGNLWSNGATTRSITVNASGTYSVLYNTGSCNSAPSAAVTVTVNPRPEQPTITASGPVAFCSGSNVVLTSSSATGNTWSTGATTQSITVSTAGTYTVTVSNGTCTSPVSASVTTSINAIPTRPTVTVTGALTFCEGGSVTLTSSATTGNLWSNGETTQAITVTTSGVYTVTTTVNGCTSSPSFGRTVTVNTAQATPTITASGSTSFCPGGSVTLTASAATTYSWSTGATTPSITVSTPGNYTVTVTGSGCGSATSEAIAVTVNAVPTTPTITASGATTFCAGGSVTLTSSSASGNIWSNGATTASITVTEAGTYTVSVSNGNCTSAVSAGTTVTVNAVPATPTITASGPTTFCAGSSVTLTSSSATGNIWSNGATTQSITVTDANSYTVSVSQNGCTSSNANAVTTTLILPMFPDFPTSLSLCAGAPAPALETTSPNGISGVWSPATISNTASATYTFTPNAGQCAAATSVNVTVVSLPATPTITASGATTFCSGGSVTLTSSSASGNVWSNGATTASITVTEAGTYTVSVNNGNCTSAVSAGTTVTVNSVPTTPTITASGATTFCAGGSVTLTSSSANGNVWSNGATTASITVTEAGTYTVSVNNGNCTSAVSAGTTVTVNAVPATPTITASGATTFCAGGSVTLTSSSANGNVWSNGATTASITVSEAGTYTVSVDNGNCTSAVSAGTTVTVNAVPMTPTITASGATTFCAGGSVTLTSSAASGNVWSNGATTASITVSEAGTYTVSVNNGNCTSAVSAGTTVTVNAVPMTPTITASGATTFCEGSSVVLTSSSATGNLWSNGATTQSITVTEAGSFTVSVTSNGCTSGTSASIITNLVAPTVPDFPTALTICEGSPVLAFDTTSANGISGVWAPATIDNTASATYTFIPNPGQCATTTSVNVTVVPLPATPTVSASGDTTFCAGGSVVLTSSSATGNLWSNGATTTSITVSEAGDYSVSVSNGNCTSAASAAVSVSVNALPEVFITQTAGVLSATPTSASYQWFQCPDTLIEGATDAEFTPLVLGDYKVQVTSGGCTVTSDCVAVVSLSNTEFAFGGHFTVYPNPVTHILNIEIGSELRQVEVFNMLGQQVLRKPAQAHTAQIDMARLPAGTYMVKVISGQATKTVKVIKD